MAPLISYRIEQKILTLAKCAVMEKKEKPATFDIDDIEFSHWEFDYGKGWIGNAWIATSTISAENYNIAFIKFRNRLFKIIPRISLISQCYIEYMTESFLIQKASEEVAFLNYIKKSDAIGLMFMENELEALNKLLSYNHIPEAFFQYWNDATNATGYSAKLLLMFSAIEALASNGENKNWELVNSILSEELTKEIFGTKEESKSALRNRLVHGEYFINQDQEKDYVELIHKKIIEYFNSEVFSEPLLNSEVNKPQRHFFGNKQQCTIFIKKENDNFQLSLKNVLEELEKKDFRNIKNFKIVNDESLQKEY